MKSLIFLFCPVIIFAQANYNKMDSTSFKNQVETMLNDTGKSFTFHKFKATDGTKILAYKNASNTEDKILFFYSVNSGIWTFKSLAGNLQTLLPIWQKVADPKAVREKLLKDRSDFVSGYSINQLEPDYWMIRL